MPTGHVDDRTIPSRGRRQSTTGLMVESETSLPLGALVEIDMRFPNMEFIYRSRGVVSWVKGQENPDQPFRVGVLVFEMDKLDSSGASMSMPSANKGNSPASVEGSEVKNTVDSGQESASRDPAYGKTVDLSSSEISLPEVPSPEAPSPEAPSPEAPSPEAEPGQPGPTEQEQEEQATQEFPKPDNVSDVLTGLLGENVVTKPASAPLDADRFCAVGDYLTQKGDIACVATMDNALANRLGAAIAMIPAPAAEKEISAKRLSEEVQESVQEIFNILTSLFNESGSAHHKFNQLYMPGKDELPDEIEAHINSPKSRVDYEIEIPGYGIGRMSYLAVS